MNIKTYSKASITISLILIIVLSACNIFSWVPPLLDELTSKESRESSPGGHLPDDQAESFNPFKEDKAFLFDWDSIAEGGGIHFDGTFLGCPNGIARTTVSIYGDLGSGAEIIEGGVNWEDLMLYPLVDSPILSHRTAVDLEGTISDPECICEIQQHIEIEFEFDFDHRNAWVKDATAHGKQVACECPGLGAAVPLIEFWFPRDLLVTLEYIDVEDTDCDM